jgi:hypothetical protein
MIKTAPLGVVRLMTLAQTTDAQYIAAERGACQSIDLMTQRFRLKSCRM